MSTKKLQDFLGMQFLADHYGNSGMSDTEFATDMCANLEHTYTMAQVRAYRKLLDIPNNKPRTPAANLARALLLRVATTVDPHHVGEDLYAAIMEFLDA